MALFCIIFYALMVFKWYNGLFLYQLHPFIFNTRFDLITWLLMQTGLHQWLLNNITGCIIFDVVFYSMPLIFWLALQRSYKAASIAAIVMLLVNWVYIQCITLYPSNSVEGFGAWLLFPLLFITVSLTSFYFMLHALRYFFLFFFASAGVWKFVQHGIFNADQMSGVLLFQHKEFLTSSPGYWYTDFIYWLVNNPTVSYSFYIAGAIAELLFFIGFFTGRYDRWLIAVFILFLVFDILLMRIHYWEVAPFLLTFIYSKYTRPSTTGRLA